MATQTSYLSLVKPAYTENVDIAVINSNMDKIDTAIKTQKTPATSWNNINVFQVTGALPDDTTSAVPTAVRPCLICSRNGSMALYW